MARIARFLLERPILMGLLVLLAIVLLPLSVWLDLRSLSDQNLTRQAKTLDSVISVARSYYAENVAGRIKDAESKTELAHDYLSRPGAVPIPATMSIELGAALSEIDDNVTYRFISDRPFRDRAPYDLNGFEARALKRFRDGLRDEVIYEARGSVFDRHYVMATPLLMEQACVSCHNSHPASDKQDWKLGDVRGIQTLTVRQPIALDILSFKWLLTYLVAAGLFGIVFMMMQRRLVEEVGRANADLARNNDFLGGVSGKISRYLSPQVYRSIFEGEKEAEISTERKKLTVFFSDIKDFTATSEALQPEELTGLINEYFGVMSEVAEKHGATIDKFIGDAMVVFFGDPETKGTALDAQACVRMALEMQHRLRDLEEVWRLRGIEHRFRTRMGINTGFCNVGNFGSATRMDYTIIGAEANLAARLEQIAEPGGIVVSYETYALVRNIVEGQPLEAVRMKGIARDVVPYAIVVPDRENSGATVSDMETKGLSLRLDVAHLNENEKAAAREILRKALMKVETGGR